MDPRHFVIVGGGTCAGSAASTLRAEGFDGAVTIVSNEPMPPYERPPLSKDYLTGKTAAGDLAINPAGWYADHGVELRGHPRHPARHRPCGPDPGRGPGPALRRAAAGHRRTSPPTAGPG